MRMPTGLYTVYVGHSPFMEYFEIVVTVKIRCLVFDKKKGNICVTKTVRHEHFRVIKKGKSKRSVKIEKKKTNQFGSL